MSDPNEIEKLKAGNGGGGAGCAPVNTFCTELMKKATTLF